MLIPFVPDFFDSCFYNTPDFIQFVILKSITIGERNRANPKLRGLRVTLNVHMHRLISLIAVKEELIWPLDKHFGHTTLRLERGCTPKGLNLPQSYVSK